MPRELIVIAVVLILGSWFLLGESRSFAEKLMLLFGVIGIYVALRLMGGATFQDIIAPLLQK